MRKDRKKKKPSKITVSDVAMVVSILGTARTILEDTILEFAERYG